MPADTPSSNPTAPTDNHPSDAAIEVYEDAAGEWRWRATAPNGDIEADSGEGFATRAAALRSAARTRTVFANATVTITDDADETAPGEGIPPAFHDVAYAGGDDE